MAALPDGITQAEINEYLKLDSIIKKADERHKVLNQKIKNVHEGKKAGAYVYDGVIVTISDRTKFDAEGFEQEYPYAMNKGVYKHVVDASAVAADTKKAFMVPDARSLSVTKAN